MKYLSITKKESGREKIDKDDSLELTELIPNREELNSKLLLGSKNGDLKMVKSALYNGANVHYRDDKAIRIASVNGNSEIVSLLIDNEANIHAYNDESLILASMYGHLEVVKLL